MLHRRFSSGPSPRAELLREQKADLSERSFFQKSRAGMLLSTVMVVAAAGGLFVGFGWQAYRDPHSETSHSVTLTFYAAGLVMCAVGFVVPILFAWRGVRWARSYRSTVVRDRGVAARRLDGPVPHDLATLWDVRRPEDRTSIVGPEKFLVLRAPHVPHARFRGGFVGLLVALMTCIVGLVNLWDPIDEPVQHAPGTMLASILALVTGITHMTVRAVMSASASDACSTRDMHLVERAAYVRATPDDKPGARVRPRSGSARAVPIAAVGILLATGVVRIFRDPMAFVVAMGIVAVFFLPILGVMLWQRRHLRTLPVMIWDQQGPAPLSCEPACRVDLTTRPGTLGVTPHRGDRPALTLGSRDVVDIVDVEGLSGTVAVMGADDILLVLTGKDAPRLVHEWWMQEHTPHTRVGPAE